MARALATQAQQAAGTAGQVGGTYQTEAQAAQSRLAPFYAQEMGAEHEFTPDQLNQLLTAAGAGTGGATGAYTGQAELEAARTRQGAGSMTGALDELARGKQQAMAKQSEGIAGQDVAGAQKLRQAGAEGMAGLFGTESKAALEAMGIQQKDIQTAIEASSTGWLQNLTGMIGALGKTAEGAGAMGLKF